MCSHRVFPIGPGAVDNFTALGNDGNESHMM
jgi:hypothetical protein